MGDNLPMWLQAELSIARVEREGEGGGQGTSDRVCWEGLRLLAESNPKKIITPRTEPP